MRVGYLGPPGTFSEAALRASVLSDGEHVPLPTIREVVLAVTGGDVGYAVVPFENSLEGSVNEALDALVHDAPGVRIVGETVLPVRYALIARGRRRRRDGEGRALASAVAGAVRALRARVAARRADPGGDLDGRGGAHRDRRGGADVRARDGARRGALRRRRAPRRSRGRPLEHDALRLLAGPGQAAPSDAGASWKSSVFFSGEGDGTPGWLLRCLAEFAERDVNLSRIESRPAKRRLGHYVFLVDVAGRGDEPGPAADAISALGEHCEEVRLLGAYPAAGG